MRSTVVEFRRAIASEAFSESEDDVREFSAEEAELEEEDFIV